ILKQEREAATGQGNKYNISVQCTIPNEFQKLAEINIGVTAGIEVDAVSPEWLLKTNQNIDLLIVPSNHSRDVFKSSVFTGSDNSVLRLDKPIEVCPEGI